MRTGDSGLIDREHNPIVPVLTLPKQKVVCTAWIGRFGNRCHSYLFGKHIEETFGGTFFIPSRWEGCVLFANPAPVLPEHARSMCGVANDDSSKFTETFLRNEEAVAAYNTSAGDSLEFIDATRKKNYGKTNIAFSSLVTDADWFFQQVSRERLKSYFAFSDELKASEVYRQLEAERGTYDIAHFRRTDTAAAGYRGGHSMVSRKSYDDAFAEVGADLKSMVWVSDEKDFGWKWNGEVPVIGGMRIGWLPDFLKLIFARRIFRSNSAFSTWAAWLSDAQVFSPWLHSYAPGQELDVRFVAGNHPHWMAVKGKHACYRFRLKGETAPEPPTDAEATDARVVEEARQQVRPGNERKRILMIHWNGRFGNRMFSFAFGRYHASAHNADFYLPSEWEGSVLFREKGCKIMEDDELRLRLNQSKQPFDNLRYRKDAMADYGNRTGIRLTHIDPNNPAHLDRTNVYFDSLCVNSPHLFSRYSRGQMLKWFDWSDEVKRLDIYRRLEDEQGTYDVAHLRRDDISSPDYNRKNHQSYSVVSKESYLQAFKKFGFDVRGIHWLTDDRTGKWIQVPKPARHGGWTYPFGCHRLPKVIFDWLPDFLRLYFARTIFRSNSSFSWWAGFLSPCAKVYSPVLRERKIYLHESDEVACEFVEGNHPHFINTASDSACSEIRIPD